MKSYELRGEKRELNLATSTVDKEKSEKLAFNKIQIKQMEMYRVIYRKEKYVMNEPWIFLKSSK